jgi:hypothetical protein
LKKKSLIKKDLSFEVKKDMLKIIYEGDDDK